MLQPKNQKSYPLSRLNDSMRLLKTKQNPLMFVIQEKQNLPSPNNKIFSSVKLVKKTFSQKHLSMLRDMWSMCPFGSNKTVDVEGCWFDSWTPPRRFQLEL